MSASEPTIATGITHVTQGPPDLVAPCRIPDGHGLRYGLGFPFQVAPKKAALFCNLRNEGYPVGDFENGTDVVLFDDLDRISAENAVPISRNDHYVNPQTAEPRIVIKHSDAGAFVPLGAKRADGSSHPHAGTGFAVNQANDFPMKEGGYYDKTDKTTSMVRKLEVYQLAYDGREFRVLRTGTKDKEDPLRAPGSKWALSPGLKQAISDGDDLLYPMQATAGDWSTWASPPLASGVSRWQRQGGEWQPVSFTVVVSTDDPFSSADGEKTIYGKTIPAHWGEASLIRDTDGALLFSARGVYGRLDHQLRVWRSTDGGESWQVIIDLPDGRAEAPITINQSADGTPYIVSNKLGHARDWLCLWPLNDERTGLNEPITVRNALEEFGPPPAGPVWFMDHPNALTTQLADGNWHNLLAYRIMDRGEHAGAPPAPQTGLYVEEVFSAGPAIAAWRFD